MKKFIIRIVLPVLVLCSALFWVGELYLRSLPNDFKTKNAYLENNADKLKVMVLGASSMSMGLKPSFLDKQPAYNFAYASQSLDYDYWILSKCFERQDSLEWVLLDFQFARPWFPYNTGDDNYNKYYTIYYSYPDNRNGTFSEKYEVAVGLQGILQRIFPKNPKQALKTIDNDGYQSGYYEDLPFDKEKWEKAVLWNLEHHSVLSDEDATQRYREGVALYCHMIELCKKRNVKVALVTLPTMSMFYEKFDSCQINIVRHLADSLSSAYSNVYYWDYFKADSLFAVDDFYNPTHLNPRGAKKFTLLLNKKMIENEDPKGCSSN